ncbi:MAG: zinc-dependent metalloprotease [Flavobacteriales bacterium]|nr:zinc-dependent metalloprotease [Flavobacteriales bacterium]
MRATVIIGLIILKALTSFSQGQVCYSDLRHKELLQDSIYSLLTNMNENRLQKELASNNLKIANNSVITIPVVVHVVHLGEAVGTGTNISDAQIISAIDHLSSSFRNSFGGSVDTRIRFCLAKRDPYCNATNGIVRIDGTSVSNYATEGIDGNISDGLGATEVSVKDLSRWPTNAYYNIWVVSEIDNNDATSGTQGYAYFPGSSSTVDGTVVVYNAFGYDPGGTIGFNLKSNTNLNKTLVHELGHAFNLYHTFQGDDANDDGIADQCPTDAVCGTSGDCVSDTKKHQRTTTCTSGANTCDSGDIIEVAKNYMGYASQTCLTSFTSGQKERMRTAIQTLRSGLIYSQGCVAPTTSVTAANCNPTVTGPSTVVGISNFKINDLNVNSTINDNGSNISDFSCLHTTNLAVNTQYTIDISHLGNSEVVKVYIDYNDNGDFTDAGEEVFSGASGTSHTGTFTTPSSPTLNTYLRLRVMSDFHPFAITSPCQDLTLGEIEEYAVRMVDYSAPANPSTQLTSSDCGSTLSELSDVIYCDVVSGATNYEWNIVNVSQGLNYTGTIGSAYNGWRLSWVPGIQFNSDYNIRIRPFVNGSWGDYGNTCVVTTPPLSSIPEPELISSDCGITLSDITEVIYCEAIQGATNYEWNIENSGLGINFTGQIGNAYNGYRLSWVPGIQLGASYNVRIKAFIGGTWGDYGNICVVTTPSSTSIPTTEVSTAYCGSTISTFGETINCNPVSGATDYEWNIVNAGQGINYTTQTGSSYTGFKLSWVPGSQLGSNYDVQVKAQVGGVWGDYGNVCTVSTPLANAHPTTNVQTSDCGITVSAMSEVIYCDEIVGATSYDWNIQNAGLGVDETINSGSSYRGFRLTWLPNVQLNTTYDVRVRAHVGGGVISYGATCQVTSSNSFKWDEHPNSDISNDQSFSIYPNPNNTLNLNINIQGFKEKPALLKIHDLLGNLIFSKNLLFHEDRAKVQMNLRNLSLSKGVYIISLNTEQIKLQEKLQIQ